MKKQGSSDKFDLSSGKSPSPERRKSVHFGSDITAKPKMALKRLKSDNVAAIERSEGGSSSSNFLEIPGLDKKKSVVPIQNLIKQKA